LVEKHNAQPWLRGIWRELVLLRTPSFPLWSGTGKPYSKTTCGSWARPGGWLSRRGRSSV